MSYLPFLYNFRISGFTVVNDFKMFFTICQGYFLLSASCINAVFLHFSPFLCRVFISFCRIYIHRVFHARQDVRLTRTPVFPTSALGFLVFADLRHFNQNGKNCVFLIFSDCFSFKHNSSAFSLAFLFTFIHFFFLFFFCYIIIGRNLLKNILFLFRNKRLQARFYMIRRL